MKSIIYRLLNLQGNKMQCAPVLYPSNKKKSTSGVAKPGPLVNKSRDRSSSKIKFRQLLPYITCHLLTADIQKKIFLVNHSEKYGEKYLGIEPISITKTPFYSFPKSYSLPQLLRAIEMLEEPQKTMLEEPQKTIVCLHFSGFRNEEIARHVSLSPQLIKKELSCILNRLDTTIRDL